MFVFIDLFDRHTCFVLRNIFGSTWAKTVLIIRQTTLHLYILWLAYVRFVRQRRNDAFYILPLYILGWGPILAVVSDTYVARNIRDCVHDNRCVGLSQRQVITKTDATNLTGNTPKCL